MAFYILYVQINGRKENATRPTEAKRTIADQMRRSGESHRVMDSIEYLNARTLDSTSKLNSKPTLATTGGAMMGCGGQHLSIRNHHSLPCQR